MPAVSKVAASLAVRELLRPLVTGLAAAFLGLILLSSGTRWIILPVLHSSVGDPWMGRVSGWHQDDGFYQAEIARQTNQVFTWTDETAHVRVPHLDRSQPHRVTLLISAGRPPGAPPPPRLRAFVDGMPAGSFVSSNRPRAFTVDLPRRSVEGADLALVASNTFLPGPDDKRTLGVIVYDVSLDATSGHFRPSWYVTLRVGLAVLLAVGGVLLCGLRSRLAVLAAVVVPVAFTWLMLVDAAFLGTFADRLLHIAIGVAVVGGVVAVARALTPAATGLPEWSIAVGLVLLVGAVKLAFFTHPQVELRDAFFQVHRAQLVHQGRYFFTSFTPAPGYEFPYAVALYVTALPLWRFFPSPLDLAAMLRGLALGADALVGVALYAAARRQWNDRLPALLCAALWPLARASGQAIGYANLTNVFGQALFGVAMGLLAWTGAGPRLSRRALLAAAGLLVAAFLSHFGTVLAGVGILVTVGLMLILRGRGALRLLGAWTLAVTLVALALSYGVYYSHFTPVYRKTMARMTSGSDRQTTHSMVAPPSLKAYRWITENQFANDYGLPGLPVFATACAGAVLLARRRRRDGLTLILAGWALVWVAFSGLGIVSRIEVRANLAAAPVFVVAAAYAIGALASSGGSDPSAGATPGSGSRRSLLRAALAAAVVLAVTWSGVRVWLTSLGR